MATVIYTVAKPFTYAGRTYQRGEVWEPGGYRADKTLIAARFVTAATLPGGATMERAEAPERRSRRAG